MPLLLFKEMGSNEVRFITFISLGEGLELHPKNYVVNVTHSKSTSMSDLKSHFDYDHWANRRLFTLTSELAGAPEKAKLLASHILNAQRIWISRINEEESPLQVWEKIPDEQWGHWLDRNRTDMKSILSQKQGNLVVQYRNSEGKTFRSSQSDILQHVLMHGAYHRGQIAQLIRPLTEVPYTDFIFYTREQMA